MKAVELAKVFNPKEFEDSIYAFWLERGVFKPADGDGAPFVIVIPPPNVTGVLHMGHALNNCLQDILVRYYRMLGRPALWVPGTDHAGIATQNVVEKRLRASRRGGISSTASGAPTSTATRRSDPRMAARTSPRPTS